MGWAQRANKTPRTPKPPKTTTGNHLRDLLIKRLERNIEKSRPKDKP